MSRRRRDSAIYGDAPPGVPLDVWRAYGDHYPGGPKRAEEARAAGKRLREQADQRRREQVARGLWDRVHPAA